MAFVALVTLLLIMQYLYFMIMVGKARGTANIQAPATTGDEIFERNLRVQMNTLEQLILTLPAMWVCAIYFSASFASAMGLTFLVGRFIYRSAYIADPGNRDKGMIIGFMASVGLLLTALWGVIGKLL